MAIVTIRNTQKYTPTFCEPSVNPCYSRPLDGPHYCGRRPHRRLRRRHTLRRQGSGPRHGLARPARRRGDRRRGHGVATPRSRRSDGSRQRRRGAAGGSDVVVQEDRLDAPRPRRRRDSRAPPRHPSAGLAQPLAERLGLHAGCATLPGGRWLIVAGSLHPATRRQIAAAGRAGLHVLATADAEHADGGDAAATLAREAASLLATESFDLIVLTGGDTAVAFYRTLGAARIDLVGAPGPGLALGYLRAPGYSALPVLTKAGGFGPPELFVSLRKEAMT